MLIMHVDDYETSSSSEVSTRLPALTKCKDMRPLVWQTETSTYPPQPTLTPPLKKAKPKTSSKQVFICTELHCNKQFPRSFALRRHMRIHTGTKPYECDYVGCMQRFNTSGNLSRHKRIHSGERPYPCIFDSCGKRFNTSTKLKRHMRIHFPDGQNVFRCVGQVDCNWSCDNYKEFAQHQKVHHNILVGAQLQHSYTRQEHYEHADADIKGSTEKDNDYFSTADSTREYSTNHHPYGNHHGAAPTGSFMYPTSFDKPKSSVLPGRNKFMGPSSFFGSSDFGSLPTVLSKDYGPDQRRMRSNVNSFASVQYSSTGGSFLICSDNNCNRPNFSNANHFVPLRRQEERDDKSYEQQQKSVPPTMNLAAPEFTGEELSVVLQLMNETY